MKYPKTTLFVVAALCLLITTAAQPDSTWHMLREGYGLHYTSSGRRAAAEAELNRVRPLMLAALETCDMASADRWSRRTSYAHSILRSSGVEIEGDRAMSQRYAGCYKARKLWWKADTLAAAAPRPEDRE